MLPRKYEALARALARVRPRPSDKNQFDNWTSLVFHAVTYLKGKDRDFDAIKFEIECYGGD